MDTRRKRNITTTAVVIERTGGVQNFHYEKTISAIRIPTELAEGTFAETMDEFTSEKLLIHPEYKMLLEQLYRTNDEELATLFKEEMEAFKKEMNAYTKDYLDWFEANRETLSFEQFGKIELYEEARITAQVNVESGLRTNKKI